MIFGFFWLAGMIFCLVVLILLFMGVIHAPPGADNEPATPEGPHTPINSGGSFIYM